MRDTYFLDKTMVNKIILSVNRIFTDVSGIALQQCDDNSITINMYNDIITILTEVVLEVPGRPEKTHSKLNPRMGKRRKSGSRPRHNHFPRQEENIIIVNYQFSDPKCLRHS